MRTAHTLALWLFAAMAVLAPRFATAARVVYKCVPSPGHPCPGTVVIRQPAPPPAPATEAPVHTLRDHQEEQQEYRIAALEQSAGQFRVELATSFDTDRNVGGILGVGGSWLLGQDLAIADAELLVGGSEAGDNGFLLGTRGDVLFVATEWLRLGPSVDLLLNFGAEEVHVDPGVAVEAGSKAIHLVLRETVEIMAANGRDTSAVGPLVFMAGVGGRW